MTEIFDSYCFMCCGSLTVKCSNRSSKPFSNKNYFSIYLVRWGFGVLGFWVLGFWGLGAMGLGPGLDNYKA